MELNNDHQLVITSERGKTRLSNLFVEVQNIPLLSSLSNTNQIFFLKVNPNLIRPLDLIPIYDEFEVQRNMFKIAQTYNFNLHWKTFARKIFWFFTEKYCEKEKRCKRKLGF